MARLIGIEGPSGRGKSTSINKLPKIGTAIINWERKKLPFQGEADYYQERPKTWKEGIDKFKALSTGVNGKVKVIIHDSFSAMTDVLIKEARILKTGWDVWSYYNEKIQDFFSICKDANDAGVYVVIIGHDDVIDSNGIITKSFKVLGNEWKGKIEKEFDMVLYATMDVVEEGKNNYQFLTQSDGVMPAKTPAGMFKDYKIPNNLYDVIKAAEIYDGIDASWLDFRKIP